MVRIQCATHQEADAIWQLWQQASFCPVPAAELWVGDVLWAQLRCGAAETTALHEAQQARSCLQADSEGC